MMVIFLRAKTRRLANEGDIKVKKVSHFNHISCDIITI